MRRMILFTFILCSGFQWNAHEYYLSVARLEYDSEHQDFEMSVWFFADDIGLKMSELAGYEVDWSADHKKAADSLLEAYLSDVLYLIDASGEDQYFELMGTREDGELIYAYLKKHEPQPEGYSAQFISLAELFESQKNLLHFKSDQGKRTLYFKKGSEPQALFE